MLLLYFSHEGFPGSRGPFLQSQYNVVFGRGNNDNKLLSKENPNTYLDGMQVLLSWIWGFLSIPQKTLPFQFFGEPLTLCVEVLESGCVALKGSPSPAPLAFSQVNKDSGIAGL